MDLDLALVRSFVVTAEELHFRRASERLFITQQALSQRIRRLETLLETPLFVRDRLVTLTADGQRFLEPARSVLAAAEDAVAALRPVEERPLRVDVVDGRLAPLRLVRRLVEEDPELPLNLSMRQTLEAALPALLRAEIDAAFGRVCDLANWPSAVTQRLVRLEPINALLPRQHRLADRDRVTLADLRETGIWMPHYGQLSEWESYTRRLAQEFDLPMTMSGPALNDEHFVQRMGENRDRACLGGGDVSYDFSPDIRVVPVVDPTPVYPWSMVWRQQQSHPLVGRLVKLADASAGEWLAYAPERYWLPQPDRKLHHTTLTGANAS